ncbi:MAG: hypothetical protein GVY12_03625 [Bacteroidetes bacterium]|jgi:uncharacterized lipoprotein YmbA|nr:hypothetical protein [Bacteroidota bacterium]
MTYAIRTIYLPLLLSLLALTGCFSLSREEPPQQHYVLGESRLQDNPAPAQSLAGLSIGLRRVQVAEYLNTPLVVVRHGAHAIRFSEFHRWGEALGAGINRAVAGHLSTRAAFNAVNVVPWPPQTRNDYLIQVHLLRFEGQVSSSTASEGAAHLMATWEIIDPQDGAVLARGTTDYQGGPWEVGDFDGLVTLLDGGVRELSDDLVARMEELVSP